MMPKNKQNFFISNNQRRFNKNKGRWYKNYNNNYSNDTKNKKEEITIRDESSINSQSTERDINASSSLSPLTSQTHLITINDTQKEEENKKDLLNNDYIPFPNIVKVTSGGIGDKYNTFNMQQLYSQGFYPWIKKDSKSSQNKGILKLHYEILEFYEFIKPTKEENALREKTYIEIEKIIHSQWENWKIEKFGSYPMDLNLPDSDLDLEILPDTNTPKHDSKRLLNKICEVFYNSNKFSYLEQIKARVPIIKATLKETNINIDISVNRTNGYEAKNTMINILNKYPSMRPIIYILKYYLKQKHLNEAFTGGVSSYILYHLVYSYFLYIRKTLHSSYLLTLGHILMEFFQFYGFDFNYDDVGISVRYGGFFYKREEKKFSSHNAKGKNILSIENFQDPTQDIGKICKKFERVIECFKNARDALYYPIEYPVKSYLGAFIYIDDLIKKRSENNK